VMFRSGKCDCRPFYSGIETAIIVNFNGTTGKLTHRIPGLREP
jgi:hypothetical protein